MKKFMKFMNFNSAHFSFMRFWHHPKARLMSKTISLIITLTFVLPYLTWAFEGKSYPLGEPAVLYHHQVVKIPEQFAKVLDAYQGKDQLVIQIQDLHCNYEVQQNIAALLDHLAKVYGVKLVTVEGASQPVNVMHLATSEPAGKGSGREILYEAGETYRGGILRGHREIPSADLPGSRNRSCTRQAAKWSRSF